MRDKGIQVEGRMDLTAYSEKLLKVIEQMGVPRW